MNPVVIINKLDYTNHKPLVNNDTQGYIEREIKIEDHAMFEVSKPLKILLITSI